MTPYDVPQLMALGQRARRAARAAGPVTPDAGPTDGVATAAEAAAFAAPSDEVEARLTAMWQELLGVDAIGPHDNFFELGGHSLLATRVLARVQSAFGVRLTLRAVFEAPTVRGMTDVIVAARDAELVTAPAEPEGEREEFEL